MNVKKYISHNVFENSRKKLTTMIGGGITKNSAIDAIKQAVDETSTRGALYAHEKQIQFENYKIKTAQQIAELTSQKDALELSLKQKEEEISALVKFVKKLSGE